MGNGREVVARYDKLDREAQTHKERWERMAPHIAPSRVGIVTKYVDGEKLNRNIYDSTTLMAAELMSMFIAGHIINPSQRWLSYKMRDLRLAKDDESKEWLEECRDISLKNTANSMFFAEGPETIVDCTGFGTGFMLIEEVPQTHVTKRGFRGFKFTAEKTGRFLIQEGPDGRVDTAFRTFDLSARVIRTQWPDANLPENITKALESGEGDRPFRIIHYIGPRAKSTQGSGYGSKGMPWESCWVEYNSKEIIHEGGYRVFPVAAPRYSKTPGEVFGRGRGDIAFSDAWTLNTAKKMSLEDWALKIRPPILHASDSVIGTLKLVPGGPTSINTGNRPISEVIQPFQTGSRPDINNINEENLRQSIRNIFYAEQILGLMEIHKSEMTAVEYLRKLELLFRLLGPVYGRLEWEWLHTSADIMFDVQYYAGAFPPPPPSVMESNGIIDVEFQNPLARAQKSADADALALVTNDIAPYAQAHPEVLDWLDLDEAVPGVMDIRGLPALWTRSKKQVQQIRAARQKQDETDLELERAGQVAEAAGKAAPALAVLQGGKQPA